jgi:hypothetical protein
MYHPSDVSPVTPVMGLTDSCAVNAIEQRRARSEATQEP